MAEESYYAEYTKANDRLQSRNRAAKPRPIDHNDPETYEELEYSGENTLIRRRTKMMQCKDCEALTKWLDGIPVEDLEDGDDTPREYHFHISVPCNRMLEVTNAEPFPVAEEDDLDELTEAMEMIIGYLWNWGLQNYMLPVGSGHSIKNKREYWCWRFRLKGTLAAWNAKNIIRRLSEQLAKHFPRVTVSDLVAVKILED